MEVEVEWWREIVCAYAHEQKYRKRMNCSYFSTIPFYYVFLLNLPCTAAYDEYSTFATHAQLQHKLLKTSYFVPTHSTYYSGKNSIQCFQYLSEVSFFLRSNDFFSQAHINSKICYKWNISFQFQITPKQNKIEIFIVVCQFQLLQTWEIVEWFLLTLLR